MYSIVAAKVFQEIIHTWGLSRGQSILNSWYSSIVSFICHTCIVAAKVFQEIIHTWGLSRGQSILNSWTVPGTARCFGVLLTHVGSAINGAM